MWTTWKWETSITWSHAEIFCEKKKDIDNEDPTPLVDQVNSGYMQREATVHLQAVRSKTHLFKKLTTTREADEKHVKRKNITVGKDHCLELWCGGWCRKLRWEILRISKERCVFSSSCGNAIHRRYLQKILKHLENSLQYVLRMSWNAMYLARIGRPDTLWSVDTLTRSVAKWNKVCDQRYLRLIHYINPTKKLQAILSCGESNWRLQT